MDYLQAWDKFQDLSYDQVPDDVVKVANQCILDWFGCAIAGSAEPLAAILGDVFGHRSGPCSVIGSELRLDAQTAALLNGATSFRPCSRARSRSPQQWRWSGTPSRSPSGWPTRSARDGTASSSMGASPKATWRACLSSAFYWRSLW